MIHTEFKSNSAEATLRNPNWGKNICIQGKAVQIFNDSVRTLLTVNKEIYKKQEWCLMLVKNSNIRNANIFNLLNTFAAPTHILIWR